MRKLSYVISQTDAATAGNGTPYNTYLKDNIMGSERISHSEAHTFREQLRKVNLARTQHRYFQFTGGEGDS